MKHVGGSLLVFSLPTSPPAWPAAALSFTHCVCVCVCVSVRADGCICVLYLSHARTVQVYYTGSDLTQVVWSTVRLSMKPSQQWLEGYVQQVTGSWCADALIVAA